MIDNKEWTIGRITCILHFSLNLSPIFTFIMEVLDMLLDLR